MSPEVCLRERPPKHDREVHVEPRAGFLGQVVALPCPGETVRKCPDTKREREGICEPVSPRLEVGIDEAREPCAVRRQVRNLLQETKGGDEGRERVRDRGVTPVEYTQAPVALVEVLVVEVVVLDRVRDAGRAELLAELAEARREAAQPLTSSSASGKSRRTSSSKRSASVSTRRSGTPCARWSSVCTASPRWSSAYAGSAASHASGWLPNAPTGLPASDSSSHCRPSS
jgi:hypothetical protein